MKKVEASGIRAENNTNSIGRIAITKMMNLGLALLTGFPRLSGSQSNNDHNPKIFNY